MSSLAAMNSRTALVRTAEGYNLRVDGIERRVNSHDIDSRLKQMDGKQLGRLAAIGGLKVNQMSNGDYRVEIGGGLKGGGAFGAWLGSTIGVVGVNIIGHGILYGVAALSGPAAPFVYSGLVVSYGPSIALASHAAGVTMGVSLAVATGPV